MPEMPDNNPMYTSVAHQIAELSGRLAGVDAMSKTVEAMDIKLGRLLEWWQQEQVRAEMRAVWQRTMEGEIHSLKEEIKGQQEQIRALRDEGLRWQLVKNAAIAALMTAVAGLAQHLWQK